ncbi:hypothetical protein KY362_04015 [Candidatus Woesearchaeota archaeon]|nr:hypothetical protein [Candidatus Woesearchaeota archaeon]
MTPTDIIALIFAVIIIAKLIMFYALKPKTMEKIAATIFKAPPVWPTTIFVIAAMVLISYITAEISVTQMMSAALFGMLMMGFVFMQYPKSYEGLVKDVMKNKNAAIIPWVLFLLLAVWTIYAIVMGVNGMA